MIDWTPVTAWISQHGVRIFTILALGVGLWFALIRFLPPLLRRSMARPVKGESKEGIKKRTDTLLSVFMGLGKITIVTVFLFTILAEFGIPIAPILTSFGIVGIAVGFGAQYLVRDLIAGTFVLLENQYRVGDEVKIAGVTGLVEEVNLRKTVLRDENGVVHHVPNGEIRVASKATRHFPRVNLNVVVAYDTDTTHALSIINRVWQELAADEEWGKLLIGAPLT